MAARRALVIGCGGMAQGWIKTLMDNPGSTVAGLVDVRHEAASASAARHGLDVPLFTDVKDALKAVKPDFVVDVTIPSAHCATAVAALKAGVPVLGEKPMSENMASARRMVKAAEAAGVLYMVSQNRRYERHHAALRNVVAADGIGPVTAVNCDFYIGAHFGGFRDEMASPLVLDMAIHHFDLCRYFTGLDPVSVYALEYNPSGSWYSGDAAATVVFEMTGGAVFTYRGSWCAEGCPTSWNGDWRVQGEHGALLMEKDQPPRGQRVAADAEPAFSRRLVDIEVPVPAEMNTGIAGSLETFLAALDSGRPPMCECHDNIKSLAMVFAAIQSSARGRRVSVKF